MAYSPAVIRNAIKSLLQGEIGAVRTVPAGTLVYGTFEGQPAQAARAKAITAPHRFDVKVGSQAMHGATPISAKSSYRISRVPVTVDIVTMLKSTTLEAERDEQRAAAEAVAQTALQALEYPGNLSADASSAPTGIVSGILVGSEGAGHPSWEVVEEDWAKTALLHRSRIVGAVVVTVDQAVA